MSRISASTVSYEAQVRAARQLWIDGLPPKRHRWLDLQRLRSDIRKLALVAYATKAERDRHQREASLEASLDYVFEFDASRHYCSKVSGDVVKLNGLRRRLTELCALRAAHRNKRHAWDAAVRSSTIERYLAPGALPPAFLLPRVIPV